MQKNRVWRIGLMVTLGALMVIMVACGAPAPAEEAATEEEAMEEEMAEAPEEEMAEEEAPAEEAAEETEANLAEEDQADDTGADAVGEAGGEPPEAQATQFPEAIYDIDDRLEWSAVDDPQLSAMADSVALLISTSVLTVNDDDSLSYSAFTLEEGIINRYGAPLCEGESFGDQPVMGHCSGFLISGDVMVTAGHCVMTQADCDSTSLLFDYHLDADGTVPRLTSESLYTCDTLITSVYEVDANGVVVLDYALLRLDRETSRPPLTLALSEPPDSVTLGVLGHPFGLPLKVATSGALIEQSLSPSLFSTNLDAFQGNSGSPVVNLETYEVEGILVAGEGEQFEQTEAGCYTPKTCPETGGECSGSVVNRSSAIFASIEPEATATTIPESTAVGDVTPDAPVPASVEEDTPARGGPCASAGFLMVFGLIAVVGGRRK